MFKRSITTIIFSSLIILSCAILSFAQQPVTPPDQDQNINSNNNQNNDQQNSDQDNVDQNSNDQKDQSDISSDQNNNNQSESIDNKPIKTTKIQWSYTLLNRTGYRIDEPRVLQMSRMSANGKAIYKFSDRWRLTAEGRIHYDPVERLGYPRRISFDLRQMLIDGRIKNVSLTVGLQQIVWGQADGIRVLDVINPLDYREFILEDFLDSRRPLWAVRTDIPLAQGSLQLVYIPYFLPGRLPSANDEFGFGQDNSFPIAGNIPQITIPIVINRNERPGYRFSASQIGARYSHSLGRWDVTANYFYGWEDIPTPNVTGFQQSPSPFITVTPRYDRKNVVGGTATTNFGPVVVRLEAGVSLNRSVVVKPSPNNSTGFEKHEQFSSVVGLDYSPKEWLTISGQYFLQAVAAPRSVLLGPRYHHLTSIYLRTNFFHDTLRPELFILTGLNQREYLIRPKLVRKFGDHFSMGVGVDLFGGSKDTIFGFYRTRDRAVIELKWIK